MESIKPARAGPWRLFASLLFSTTLHAAEVSPQLSILSLLQFDVTGAGYVASLGDRFLTIPVISFEAGMALTRSERYSLAALLRFGYGAKRANARLVNVGAPSTDSEGSLSWMPLLVGLRTRFFIASIPFFRPSITAGLGGSWLRFTPDDRQGIDSFVPLAFITPAIHIFEPIEAVGGSVFQGFTFGLSYQRALFSVQRFQAIAFEISAQWTL